MFDRLCLLIVSFLCGDEHWSGEKEGRGVQRRSGSAGNCVGDVFRAATVAV